MTSKNKLYYLKKETLAKNLLRSCRTDIKTLAYLDKLISEMYDSNKKESEKYKDRMKKLKSLHIEFNVNPRKFAKKYASMDNNHAVLKMLKEYPKLFRNEQF